MEYFWSYVIKNIPSLVCVRDRHLEPTWKYARSPFFHPHQNVENVCLPVNIASEPLQAANGSEVGSSCSGSGLCSSSGLGLRLSLCS